MWPLKVCAIPSGMFASQVWVTPFLRQGKEMDIPIQKIPVAADLTEEDYDVQGQNFFMVHNARVWSRASAVQVVLGCNSAVQCFNSKQ